MYPIVVHFWRLLLRPRHRTQVRVSGCDEGPSVRPSHVLSGLFQPWGYPPRIQAGEKWLGKRHISVLGVLDAGDIAEVSRLCETFFYLRKSGQNDHRLSEMCLIFCLYSLKERVLCCWVSRGQYLAVFLHYFDMLEHFHLEHFHTSHLVITPMQMQRRYNALCLQLDFK